MILVRCWLVMTLMSMMRMLANDGICLHLEWAKNLPRRVHMNSIPSPCVLCLIAFPSDPVMFAGVLESL